MQGSRERPRLEEVVGRPLGEISDLVAEVAPHPLGEPGSGPLSAAKLIGEIVGATRFSTEAKLARAAGVAPIR